MRSPMGFSTSRVSSWTRGRTQSPGRESYGGVFAVRMRARRTTARSRSHRPDRTKAISIRPSQSGQPAPGFPQCLTGSASHVTPLFDGRAVDRPFRRRFGFRCATAHPILHLLVEVLGVAHVGNPRLMRAVAATGERHPVPAASARPELPIGGDRLVSPRTFGKVSIVLSPPRAA